MDSFTNFGDIDDKGYAMIDGDSVKLVKVQILPATSAVNCGMSSTWCKISRHQGPPPTLYDVVQEMGCVDRSLTAAPGTNVYVIYICFYTILHLYVPIMKCKNKAEQDRQHVAMMEVLRFLVTPDECCHLFVEAYFQEDATKQREPCGKYCVHCNGDVCDLTGRFYA